MNESVLYRLKNLIDQSIISIEKSQFKIGRATINDLAIETNRYISSSHCLFEYDNGHVYIRDTSSNGTLINRMKKINKNEDPIELQSGDIIHLVFRKDEPSANVIYQLDIPPIGKSKRKTVNDEIENEFKRLKANENLTNQAREEMEDILTCLCCQDVMSNPICLEPCLHAFCHNCYRSWERVQRTCPKCRVKVTGTKKNVVINGILDAFYKAYPERKPMLTSIENQNSTIISTENQIEEEEDEDEDQDEFEDEDEDELEDDDDEEEEEEEEEENLFVLTMSTPVPDVRFRCQQCPPDRFVRRRNPMDYQCQPGENHILCQCCTQAMPDRRNQPDIHQNCEICHQYFCNLYYDHCQRSDCSGCLNELKHMNFNARHLTNFVNNNQVETQILRNYLVKHRLSISDLLHMCCQRLDRKEFQSSIINQTTSISSKSIVCYQCGLKIFKDLAYQSRASLKTTDILPSNLRQREDCYYGKHCRTQHTKIAHAQKYNHACEQKKF